MDKKYLQQKIKELKENIKRAEDNIVKATEHKEEGELILRAFEEELKSL